MLASIKPPAGISDQHMEYFNASLQACRKLIGYYNWKDWIDEKGKKGNFEKEYIGYIMENEVNVKGQSEEITTVWGEMTVDMSADDCRELLRVPENAY